MDINLLEPEEFKVECELRNIRGLKSVQESLLKDYFVWEASGVNIQPDKAHALALKNPNREVAVCAAKLVEIRDLLTSELKSQSNFKDLFLLTMRTRAQHYRLRLMRISKSPAAQVGVVPVLQMCNDLIKILENARIEKEDLNKSILELEGWSAEPAREIIQEQIALENNESSSKPNFLDQATSSNLSLIVSTTSKQVSNESTLNNFCSTTSDSSAVRAGPSYSQAPCSSYLQSVWSNSINILPPPGGNQNLEEFSRWSANIDPQLQNVNSIITPIGSRVLGNIPRSSMHVLQDLPYHVSSHVSANPVSVAFQNQPANANYVNRSQHYNSNKPSVVHKWNLSFDGSKEGLNIHRFLYRVESNASSYNLPELQLLTDIQYVLKGKALHWYWAYRESNRPGSWADFRNAMTRHFQDDHNDFDVRQTIGERKQRSNENFQDFFTAISELSLSLTQPLSDFDLTLILHGNMRTGLKEKLAGRRFRSSSELFDECVHIENAWRQISYVPEQFMQTSTPRQPQTFTNRNVSKPYPPRSVHEVVFEQSSEVSNPETQQPVYEFTQDQHHDISAVVQNNGTNRSNHIHFSQSLFAKVKCWNCQQTGHFFYRCPKEPQHIFCRGCGQPDILFEYCSKCQENLKRGVRVPNQQPNQLPHCNQPNQQYVKPQMEEVACNTDPEFYKLLKRQQ